MSKLAGVIAATILLAALPVVAQDAAPAAAPESVQGPVSLQQAVDLALANQINILTGRNNVTIARSRLSQARSSYWPQVRITNSLFRVGRSSSGRSETGTAITATQNLFDMGLREANVQQNIYGVRESQYGLQRTVQAVVFDVARAYYEVLRAKRLAEVQQSDVTYNQELRKQIEARVEVGTAARSDVLPVEAQLATAQVNLLAARNAVQTALVQLQNTMGLYPQPGFDVQDVTEASDVDIAALEQYRQQALAQRPDIPGTEAATGAARAAARAARINMLPRLEIDASYTRNLSGNTVFNDQGIFGGIVFDIFNGGANRALYRQAQEAQANAWLQQQQTLKDINADVEQAYLNLTNAKERQSVAQVSLDAAQSNYNAQSEKYKEGVATLLDVLNAQVQLVTAQSNLIQARYDLYEAVSQMQFAAGQGGTTNGEK